MKKIAAFVMAFLFASGCAGLPTVKETTNYSGEWTGQSYINAQGMVDNLNLVLVHEADEISGVISDSQGFMSNTPLSDTKLTGKILVFSFVAATQMGNMQINSTGTFSEDGKTLDLSFTIPDMNIEGNASLKKS